ncbi:MULTISPECIES: PAS domain S-box protein [Planktothrix]|uniref:histidine kinase n=1 Tax=Planktothrix rubescens CCAP 1459/22 TaxID=329571 RepID=A0A6J7ZJL0_PLARU|nr:MULTISPECIES: PAS domain S-box protein [Planktothrix]CAC5342796.1 Multi-sensor signal transduction histidine kinase [Planktothrix rubescens NIVA-CYA 18]CAD5973362.1 Cyanobacterial phytochrome B [Planktothrix rubescens NIVA-CYA 18]
MNQTNPPFPQTVDLTNCDREPIHIPGLIQSHGILFVLQEPQLEILQVSNNIFQILGIHPQEILGKKLKKILKPRLIEEIQKKLAEELGTINPLKLSINTPKGKLFFDGIFHRSNGLLIMELEPVTSKEFSDFWSLYHLVQTPIAKIQKTFTLNELCQVIVKEVRKLTGFDRVMIYQFDAEESGMVIAEDKLEELVPYLGLHYPASDIPLQARELYKLNLLRLIPDINYQPVELIPVNNPVTNQPIDLSFSVLRSVSPIHIEYLKTMDMGVGATMTISLIRNQQLWGLIACHHQSPKYIPYEIRTACELLGKVMALKLTYKEDNETLDYRIKLNSIQSKFVEAISQEDSFLDGLLKEKTNLLDLVGAQGAAIFTDENLTLIGQTPELADIQELINWFTKTIKQDIFYTDSLPKLYPVAEKFKQVGSGVLVLPIDNIQKHYVLWFRPEVIQTVNWAGNPNKPVEVEQNGNQRLTPRKSFDLWQETVRFKSLPWQQCEIDIALELRSAIVGIVLRKADELAKVNQQLTLALSAVKMGIWDFDLLTNQMIWSSDHEKIFGLEPGSFDGTFETFESCIYPEDRAAILLAVEQARLERQDYQHQFRVVWPDGSIHWIEAKGKFFYDSDGNPVRMLGTVVEISDRKAREAQLRLLESVVISTNDSIVITEIDLISPRIIYVNPAFTRMTGYTLEEVLGKTPRILQGEKTDKTVLARLHTALQNWQPLQVDLINYRKDGSPFWVELSIVPVADEKGCYTNWVAVQRDITERKQAEANLQQLNQELEIRVQQRTHALLSSQTALQQSEAEFRSLSENSPIGIFRMDAQGRCTYTNPRCQAICGYTFDQALGEGWLEFVHPEDREGLIEQWSQTLSSQREFSAEVRYLHQDRTLRFAQMRISPLSKTISQLIGHVGTVEDITERRAIETMKSEFISIVSHELRTPMTSIRGSLGLLAAGVFKNQPESAQKMLDIAVHDTERLVRLVNDILDLERLDSQKVNLVKQWCDLVTLMEQSVETVQSLAEESQILLLVEPTSVQVFVDHDRIIQTLVNLVSNAIKFSPPETTVTLSIQDQADQILFEVKDQGRGIPADQLETIFGRFQQVDASDSRQKGGTGLGLAISKSIVQQHGGKLWVESIVGEGSSFYFTLPKLLD